MRADFTTVRDRLLAEPGVVMLLGGIDAGKTTFATDLLERAAEASIAAALVDADIAHPTVGPPTTVGLRLWGPGASPGSTSPDGLGFVGAVAPKGHALSLVTSTAKLVVRARAAGAKLIVVDTTGYVSGIYGQSLKFFKMDLIDPDFVVAFERGGELEPLVGIAERFTRAAVLEIDVSGADLPERSVEERVALREQAFAAYFAAGSSRWRVKPTVFMPTLPPDFEIAGLDGLVVGMEDGLGACIGIGILEHDPSDEILRMVSPVTQGVKGLRLGSVKVDVTGRLRGAVDLPELFHTE